MKTQVVNQMGNDLPFGCPCCENRFFETEAQQLKHFFKYHGIDGEKFEEATPESTFMIWLKLYEKTTNWKVSN